MWKRFGDAENDKGSGPDPATTQVADEVFLTLTTSKEVSHRINQMLCFYVT